MEKKYDFKFSSLSESEKSDVLNYFNNNHSTKFKEIIMSCEQGVGLTGGQKRTLPKGNSKYSSKKIIGTAKFFIKVDRSGYLDDKFDELIHHVFYKFGDEGIFSTDETTRFNSLTKLLDNDSIASDDFATILAIFNIKNSELIESYENKLTELKDESDKKVELLTYKKETDELKEKIKKIESDKDKEIQKLTKEKIKAIDKLTAQKADLSMKIKEEKKLNVDLNKKINSLTDENKKLLNANNELTENNKQLFSEDEIIRRVDEKVKEIKDKLISEQAKNNNDNNNSEVHQQLEQVELVDYDGIDIIEGLENTVLIGMVNFQSLKMDRNNKWIIGITPVQSMEKDSYNTDWDDFFSLVDLKNNQLSFLTYINDDVSYYKLNIDDLYDYDTDEQVTILYEALKNKYVLFRPYFNDVNDIKKCNAEIIEVFDSKYDLTTTSLVPSFEDRSILRTIENKESIYLPVYSSCFYSSLKYIMINGDLYQVNMKCRNNQFDWVSIDGSYKLIMSDFTSHVSNTSYIYNLNKKVFFLKDEVFTYIKTLNNTSEKSGMEKNKKNQEVKIVQNNNDSEDEFIKNVYLTAKESNLDYSYRDIVNFHIALKSSQLVILAGSSGTGKTQLPFIYTKTLKMAEELNNVLFIPISPSYTEPSDILGYFKPNMNSSKNPSINENKQNQQNDAEKSKEMDGTFIESETGLVKFLIEASKNRNKLYAVIFDEMNLSQIEYWFSPFMSILEKNTGERRLTLYSDALNCSNSNIIPPSITIGDNVLFIGTINLDETTKELSDRLIDRSIIINLERKKIKDYYSKMLKSDTNEIKSQKYDNSLFFTFRKKEENYISLFTEKEIDFFVELNEYINKENSQKEVSYRTLKTIGNYLNNATNLTSYLSRKEALDLIVKETIIMKIKGSDNSIRKILDKDTGLTSILDKYDSISDFNETRSALERKLNELNNYGYTR